MPCSLSRSLSLSAALTLQFFFGMLRDADPSFGDAGHLRFHCRYGAAQEAVHRAYQDRFAGNNSIHRYTTAPNLHKQVPTQSWPTESVVRFAPAQQA